MNREELFGAIGGIQDTYIEEANPELASPPIPLVRRLRPYIGMAAVFVLVIGLAVLGRNTLFRSGSTGSAEFSRATADNARADTAAASPEAAGGLETVEETAAEYGLYSKDQAEGTTEDKAQFIMESGLLSPETLLPITYGGEVYAPVWAELETEMPSGCQQVGELSTETDAVFYLENASLEGSLVYQIASEENTLYVAYADGWQRYEK